MSQGLENLDALLENSGRIAQGMESLEGAPLSNELNGLREAEERLAGLKDKFFMNTVAAIPATKACLTGSEKVVSALETVQGSQDETTLNALKNALGELSEAVEELLEKADMRGTTLT